MAQTNGSCQMVSSCVLSIVQPRTCWIGDDDQAVTQWAICWLQQLVFSFDDRIHGSHWSIAAKGSGNTAGNERKKWSIGWNQHLNNGMGNIDRSLTNELNPFSLYNETDTKADKWNRVKLYILDTPKLIGSRQGRSFYALTWCTEHPGREAKQLLLFFSKIELFSLKKLGSRKSKNLWIHRIGSKTRSNFLGNETSWRILDLMSNLYQGKS